MKLKTLRKNLIANILVLILIGCTTKPLVSPPINTCKLDAEIPDSYLVKCVWPQYVPQNDDTPKTHLYIDTQNLTEHVNCYLRHNGLVDLLLKRLADDK